MTAVLFQVLIYLVPGWKEKVLENELDAEPPITGIKLIILSHPDKSLCQEWGPNPLT